MTKDEIIEMAQKAGMKANPGYFEKNKEHVSATNALGSSIPLSWLEKFVELVAAKEREECGKLCDASTIHYPEGMGSDAEFYEWGVEACAEAIRARGG